MGGTFIRDLRYGIRVLFKSPGFLAAAVLSLALGIGANTAIFSLVNSVLFRPLPVKDSEQLVRIYTNDGERDSNPSSYPDYVDYRDQSEVFSGLIANSPMRVSLGDSGEVELVWGEMVSGNYFSVLGVTPILGRALLPEEERDPGANPVTVLSYGLWKRRFGGDPGLVGKTIRFNGHNFNVVGIAPEGFTGTFVGFAPDFWVPVSMQPQVWLPGSDLLNRRTSQWLYLVGRLKPGVSLEQAQSRMNSLAEQIQQANGQTDVKKSIALFPANQVRVFPGVDSILTVVSTVLMVLIGSVLLIACVNVANLLLARASTRRREIATRLAVGASRMRILRQLMTESLLLSLMGGALGLLMAYWTTNLLMSFRLPTPISLSLNMRPDLRVLGFTLALSVLTAFVFGLLPAAQAARQDLVSGIKDGAASRGPWGKRVRSMLVVCQVALSLMLLICAGLFVRSLQNAHAISPGFDVDRVMALSFDPSLRGYSAAESLRLSQQLIERVSALPEVQSATLSTGIPLTLEIRLEGVVIEGHEPAAGRSPTFIDMNAVGPGYFKTMGIPLLRGRDYTFNDGPDAPKVVIINEAMARRYWPNEDPLGKHFRLSGPQGASLEIIGLAGNSKYRTLGEDPIPFMYLPLLQQYEPGDSSQGVTLLVRGAGNIKALLMPVRQEVQALDANLPIFNVQTLIDRISVSFMLPRVAAVLFGAFGFLGLLLAMVGIYGVLSYSVNQRTHEIGLRMALGAQQSDVLKLVLKEGMILVGIGILLGLLAALALTRVLASLLYGVSATDFLTFTVILLLFVAVALVAILIPARRATRVNPTITLRYE